MITKMLCSPYSKTEPWSVAASCHRGTIYLSEVETEEAREHTRNQTPRMEQMCYWGLKFEDYLTSKGETFILVNYVWRYIYVHLESLFLQCVNAVIVSKKVIGTTS